MLVRKIVKRYKGREGGGREGREGGLGGGVGGREGALQMGPGLIYSFMICCVHLKLDALV